MLKNKIIGKYGEDLAVLYLEKKGYKILDRNVKISYKEIDIVSKKGSKIVFVEVKTRTTSAFGSADESLRRTQIKNLKKALAIYLYKNNYNQNNVRLDLIAIDVDKNNKSANIKHYKDIF